MLLEFLQLYLNHSSHWPLSSHHTGLLEIWLCVCLKPSFRTHYLANVIHSTDVSINVTSPKWCLCIPYPSQSELSCFIPSYSTCTSSLHLSPFLIGYLCLYLIMAWLPNLFYEMKEICFAHYWILSAPHTPAMWQTYSNLPSNFPLNKMFLPG